MVDLLIDCALLGLDEWIEWKYSRESTVSHLESTSHVTRYRVRY